MDRYLAWVVYLFGVIGGDATVAIYFALVAGWDGLPGIIGALFCTAVGVIPTLASTRGRDITFRGLNTVLAFALAAGCVFTGTTAFKLIRSLKYHSAAAQRDIARGQKVSEAVADARRQGMRSRDAAEVGRAVSSAVSVEGQAIKQQGGEALEEPPWFPYFPWVVGGIVAALSVVLLIPYRKIEDQNADGVPDFLQSRTAEDAPKA
jgi:hypothetical protein